MIASIDFCVSLSTSGTPSVTSSTSNPLDSTDLAKFVNTSASTLEESPERTSADYISHKLHERPFEA